jgi:NhaA family Na+:H+ antiporter
MMKSGVHATISGVLLAFAIPFTKDDDSNPSYHIQQFLHKPVSFVILPIFALANTGLILHEGWGHQMFNHNNLGIILGLMIGKPLGIFLFSWLLIRIKWSALPYRVTWVHLLGAGMLAGIGFTMSIFISNLAFKDADLIQFSKIAVLTGSLLSCGLGLVTLFFTPEGAENNNSH